MLGSGGMIFNEIIEITRWQVLIVLPNWEASLWKWFSARGNHRHLSYSSSTLLHKEVNPESETGISLRQLKNSPTS